jgi:F-type H+-transporting ATPase subunit epsilon
MSLQIRVITPDKVVRKISSNEIILPTITGQLGVLKNHAPLVTAVDIGVLRIKEEEKWAPLILLGGIAIVKNNEITILVKNIEEINTETTLPETSEVEAVTVEIANAKTNKEKLDATSKLKLLSARKLAINFL